MEKTTRPARRERGFNNSLSYGLAVLEAVAESENDISLAELAKRVGLEKTKAWRLVHTLLDLGYLQRNAETKRLAPASRVLSLGYGYFERLDLRQLATPFLKELSIRVREMVSLAIPDGDELVFVERTATQQLFSVNVQLGSRYTFYNTALGRALIADMPNAWLRQYMSRLRGDPEARKYVAAGGKCLLELLSEVRQQGYSLSDNERAPGLRSIASPIRDKTANVVAAINILVPVGRLSIQEMRQRLAPELLETAARISNALGFRPPKTHPTHR